ncbi:MAG TPA: outer membrane beta-barrel protein [Opitutaceae bacterium]|nr:outer membrane beta-barrel protein [Opitutaceae bacterium]
MKTLRSTAGLFIFPILFVCPSLATIPLGRGEVAISASVSGTYDSNVSGRRGSQEDFYGTFAPRISYLRRAGKIEADASVSISSVRYVDSQQFNSDNVAADVSLQLSEKSFQNISASVSAGYTESYQIDQDLNARIKSDVTTFSGQLGLVPSPRTSVTMHASYSDAENTGASDQQMLSGGGAFNFNNLMGNTTVILSYDYTSAESSGENLLGAELDQNSHHFSLGLSRPLYREVTGRINYGYRILNRSAAETTAGTTRQAGTVLSATIDGPFLPARAFPKIKSHLSLSYQDATTPGVNDPGTKLLTGDLSLSWEARESTTLSLGTSRTQRLAVTDISVVTTSARASVTQKLRYNLSGSAGVNYEWNTYKGIPRSDEVFSYDGALNYDFAHSWTASASYRYQSSQSNQVVSDYVRHLAILSLGYTF